MVAAILAALGLVLNNQGQADRILTNGTLSSGVTSPLSGTVNIQGQFIVDADFTFKITNRKHHARTGHHVQAVIVNHGHQAAHSGVICFRHEGVHCYVCARFGC